MKLLALDPGKTSGIAFAEWRDGGIVGFQSFPTPMLDALRLVNWFVEEKMYMERLVVCESWTPRPGIRTFQPEALESIGACRYLCWKSDIPFELQQPAEAKRFATNEKLATLGWRRPGPGGHADDAARHLLVAAVKHGLIDPAVFLG